MGIAISIDGSLRPTGEATVSVLDRGFLYGDSAFEVLRTYEGRPFAAAEHLDRLACSCERLLIRMPVGVQVLVDEIDACLRASQNDESYVRVVITRGSGPLNYDPTTAEQPTRVVIAAPLSPFPRKFYEEGVAVVLLRASRPSDDPRAAGAKASNYLASLLAVHEARSRGGYEALLTGIGGQVLEGATSNVFVVDGTTLRTPPTDYGILPGITRAKVLEIAAALGLGLVEEQLFPPDLYRAEEVFITSTLKEVMPVTKVDGVAVGPTGRQGQVGPWARRLREAFHAHIKHPS